MFATAFSCCVTPMAQQQIIAFDPAMTAAISRMRASVMPALAVMLSHDSVARSSQYGSKPSVNSPMNARSMRSACDSTNAF